MTEHIKQGPINSAGIPLSGIDFITYQKKVRGERLFAERIRRGLRSTQDRSPLTPNQAMAQLNVDSDKGLLTEILDANSALERVARAARETPKILSSPPLPAHQYTRAVDKLFNSRRSEIRDHLKTIRGNVFILSGQPKMLVAQAFWSLQEDSQKAKVKVLREGMQSYLQEVDELPDFDTYEDFLRKMNKLEKPNSEEAILPRSVYSRWFVRGLEIDYFRSSVIRDRVSWSRVPLTLKNSRFKQRTVELENFLKSCCWGFVHPEFEEPESLNK